MTTRSPDRTPQRGGPRPLSAIRTLLASEATGGLIIGGLAFADPQHETTVKLDVLAVSALSGLVGAAILLLARLRMAKA